jgi:hypothetical protein
MTKPCASTQQVSNSSTADGENHFTTGQLYPGRGGPLQPPLLQHAKQAHSLSNAKPCVIKTAAVVVAPKREQ